MECKNNLDNLKNYFEQFECNQSNLNEIENEKENLQKQLNDTSTWIGHTITKTKTINSELMKSYDLLWNKYENSKKELDQKRDHIKNLNEEVDQYIKNFDNIKCRLKVQEEKNRYLEEQKNKLEIYLKEEKNNIYLYECQNESQKKCLEKKFDAFNEITKTIAEKVDKSNEDNWILSLRNDHLEKNRLNFLRKVEKSEFTQMQLNNEINTLNAEIKIKENHNTELTRTLSEQKKCLDEQTKLLEDSKKKIEELEEMNAKENNEACSFVDKLRLEYSKVEEEREKLETKVRERANELKNFELQNERLMKNVEESHYKIGTIRKNSVENQKVSMEKVEKLRDDINILQNDVAEKNQTITELYEKLSEAKRMYKIEVDNVYKL